MRPNRLASLAGGAVMALAAAQPVAAGGLPFDLPFLGPPSFEPRWTGIHVGSQAGYSFRTDLISGFDVDGDLALGRRKSAADGCQGDPRSATGPRGTTLGWLDDTSSYCAVDALFRFGRQARITRFAPEADATSSDKGRGLEAVEAGLFAGADLQLRRLVLGVLADINVLGFDPGLSRPRDVASIEAPSAGTPELAWYASLRARTGVTLGRFLGYAHGGMIIAKAERSSTRGQPVDETVLGYTLGGGVEAMLTPRASARLEYQYAEVGAAGLDELLAGRSTNADIDFQTVRLALALRF